MRAVLLSIMPPFWVMGHWYYTHAARQIDPLNPDVILVLTRRRYYADRLGIS